MSLHGQPDLPRSPDSFNLVLNVGGFQGRRFRLLSEAGVRQSSRHQCPVPVICLSTLQPVKSPVNSVNGLARNVDQEVVNPHPASVPTGHRAARSEQSAAAAPPRWAAPYACQNTSE